MKKIKIRIVVYNNGGNIRYGIQQKKWCGPWKSYKQDYGSQKILSLFGNYSLCIEEVYNRQKLKKEQLKLIEYPSLIVKMTQ